MVVKGLSSGLSILIWQMHPLSFLVTPSFSQTFRHYTQIKRTQPTFTGLGKMPPDVDETAFRDNITVGVVPLLL